MSLRVVTLAAISLSLFFLSACANILQEPPENPQTISSVLPSKEEPKVVRTLGSLWTPTSAWNNLYSATTSRQEGDLLEITLTQTVKNRIEGLRKKLLKEKYGDENYEPPSKKDAGVLAGDAKEAPEPVRRAPVEPLPSTMQAVIQDVGQRGVYRVSAFATIKVGEDEPRLYIEGIVRDRDIDSDDKFSSDSIYGTKIELRPRSAAAPTENKVANADAPAGGSNVSW